jgi:hypothetical protein
MKFPLISSFDIPQLTFGYQSRCWPEGLSHERTPNVRRSILKKIHLSLQHVGSFPLEYKEESNGKNLNRSQLQL